MYPYASRVTVEDRWAMTAYIRALQLRQSATMADVPSGQKVPSVAPRFGEPGSGATLPVPEVAPKPSSPETEEPK